MLIHVNSSIVHELLPWQRKTIAFHLCHWHCAPLKQKQVSGIIRVLGAFVILHPQCLEVAEHATINT